MKSDVPSWMQEPDVAPATVGGIRDHWRNSPRFRRRAIVAAALLVVAAGLGVALALLPERPPKHNFDRGGGEASGLAVILVSAFVGAFVLCFLFMCYRLARELRGLSTGQGRATGPSPRDFEADRGTARMWRSLGRRD